MSDMRRNAFTATQARAVQMIIIRKLQNAGYTTYRAHNHSVLNNINDLAVRDCP